MKELWIAIDASLSPNRKKQLLATAIPLYDVVLTGAGTAEIARGTKTKVATKGDKGDILVLETFDQKRIQELKATGRTVAVTVTIRSAADEEQALRAAALSIDYIIIRCPDWKIIPLENLIAKTRGRIQLLAEVSSAKEAKVALETLELGADGVVLRTSKPTEIVKTAAITKEETAKVKLTPVEIVEIKEIGKGARVCVDTCDLMKPGEGILVGCQSSGLFLVQAEVRESLYVETRPFRVNAGPVSLYTLSSPTKTRYLSELKAGDEVLIVNRRGATRSTNIARVKIEWRPMLLLEALYQGVRVKTIVQNAETIRLVTESASKSVVDLKLGDKVLAYLVEGGRHFGTLVKDVTVIER